MRPDVCAVRTTGKIVVIKQARKQRKQGGPKIKVKVTKAEQFSLGTEVWVCSLALPKNHVARQSVPWTNLRGILLEGRICNRSPKHRIAPNNAPNWRTWGDDIILEARRWWGDDIIRKLSGLWSTAPRRSVEGALERRPSRLSA